MLMKLFRCNPTNCHQKQKTTVVSWMTCQCTGCSSIVQKNFFSLFFLVWFSSSFAVCLQLIEIKFHCYSNMSCDCLSISHYYLLSHRSTVFIIYDIEPHTMSGTIQYEHVNNITPIHYGHLYYRQHIMH